jgi:hypothetical protein
MVCHQNVLMCDGAPKADVMPSALSKVQAMAEGGTSKRQHPDSSTSVHHEFCACQRVTQTSQTIDIIQLAPGASGGPVSQPATRLASSFRIVIKFGMVEVVPVPGAVTVAAQMIASKQCKVRV